MSRPSDTVTCPECEGSGCGSCGPDCDCDGAGCGTCGGSGTTTPEKADAYQARWDGYI